MPVRIKHNFRDVIARVKIARKDMPKARAKALKAVGKELLTYVQEDYMSKASGGSDKAGNKWKPLAASTVEYKKKQGLDPRIGVATAEQISTLDYNVDGNRVDVGAVTPYAVHFDEVRPIVEEGSLFAPERLAKVEDLLVKHMEKGIKPVTK